MGSETLEFVRDLAGGLYVSVASIALLLLLCSIIIAGKRIPSKLLFYLVTMAQSSVRSWLFLVNSEYYVRVMKEKGLLFMIFLDLLPEALFILIYLQLLCVWIEITYNGVTLRRYSEKRLMCMKCISFLLLVVSCIIFFGVVNSKIPSGEEHSWVFYETVSNWESDFITGWSAAVFSAYIITGTLLYKLLSRRLPQNSMSKPSRKWKGKKVIGLSVSCTIAFVLRAGYVYALNTYVRKKRQKKEISEDTFAWIFFFYFAVTEITFHFISLTVFGYGVVRDVVRRFCKRRRLVMEEEPTWPPPYMYKHHRI